MKQQSTDSDHLWKAAGRPIELARYMINATKPDAPYRLGLRQFRQFDFDTELLDDIIKLSCMQRGKAADY